MAKHLQRDLENLQLCQIRFAFLQCPDCQSPRRQPAWPDWASGMINTPGRRYPNARLPGSLNQQRGQEWSEKQVPVRHLVLRDPEVAASLLVALLQIEGRNQVFVQPEGQRRQRLADHQGVRPGF